MSPTIVSILVWGGAATALIGIFGLAQVIRGARRLRRAPPDPAEARRALARLQALNLAAVATAFLGLAAVAAAAILG